LDQLIAKALVIALSMIVDDEFGDSLTQRRLPDEDHPIQAFFLDRAHEALGIRIQIGRSGRQSDHSGSRLRDQLSELSRVLRVTI
jgi:hypothetical protein